MTTSLRLPPSERDLEIYQQITMRGLSTRLVAEDHEISQTRVRQIVRRVLDWVAATLPEQPETDARRELRLAQHIAADRLQESYCELMSQWRQMHEPRIFGQLLRVTLAASRLPALPGTIDGLIADAIEGPLLNSSPPPGDCSPQSASAPQPNRNEEPCVGATAVAEVGCTSDFISSDCSHTLSNASENPLLTSPSRHRVTQVRVASDAPAEVTLEAIRHRREHQKRGFVPRAAR
jgi:hypothetical protein